MFRPTSPPVARACAGHVRETAGSGRTEAVEQEGLRIGFLRRQAGGAVEQPDILQPRRVHAGHRVGGKLVDAGPLPDRQLDRHALGIHPFGIKCGQRPQPIARGLAVEAGVPDDRGDPSVAPGLQHGFQERGAVAEAAIEAALGDAEVLCQHFYPHPLDASAGNHLQAGLDPALAAHFATSRVCSGVDPGVVHPAAPNWFDTVPYC